jgi:hypothetical protein
VFGGCLDQASDAFRLNADGRDGGMCHRYLTWCAERKEPCFCSSTNWRQCSLADSGYSIRLDGLERHGKCSEDVQAAVSDGGVAGIKDKDGSDGYGQ